MSAPRVLAVSAHVPSGRQLVFNCPIMQASPFVTIIQPSRGRSALRLREIWAFRELLLFLIWRDILVRYKQTIFGVGWALLRPLMTTALLSYVFGYLARLPSGNARYPLFCFCGVLPWTYFSEAVSASSSSLIGNQHLISKIYFPRLLIPLSAVGRGLVDFGCAFFVLICMMLRYGVFPSWSILALPIFLAFAFLTALGVGLWFSALTVQFRDTTHVLPFLLQLWFWATPVAYGSDLVPPKLHWLHWLNPMTVVVDGFRWAILGTPPPSPPAMTICGTITLLLLASGILFFRQMERQFADVI